ncbi:MAG: chitobiase/beta-hexosaminidase C-terminal domain-containing protein [Muribaculaceae bacterium]|nr:chitobiase/beta-hexosaminidase C-terminal domain-containing protein [Muribaculaceae bacterium]
MKKHSLYIASFALAALAFTSCDNEFERPPMVLPTSTWEANTTIEELKAAYWETVEGTPQTIGLTAEGDSVIIKGRVCSSDESGNIFKALYVQSTDKTDGEAITFVLDFYDIYQTYKLGQEIYVNLTGLTIGGYRGLMQVGIDNAGQVGRVPEATFALHAQGNGLPSVAKIDTLTTTIEAVETAKATAEGLQTWQARLVRFDNVRFENAGEPFAVGTSSNSRYIIDEAGKRINVYNSTYADFKDELLPSGNGSVVGILSYFGSNWQVLLNGIDGCIGFNGVAMPVFSPAGGTVKPGTEVTITCPTEEAEIHYTLDGSDPTISSTLYTEPIIISEAVTIKAIATKPGHDASTIVTATFTVSADAPAEGDGTEASPYSVAQVIALNPTSTKDAVATDVWAQGYIVGYIPTGGSSTTLSITVFGADANAAASNIVVAPTKDETNPANCMAIQLASGSDVRAAANLKDHPENLGKLLTVKGSVYKYCDAPGIKDVSAFKLDGEGSGPVTPEPPAGTAVYSSLSENDEALPAGWTIDNVNIGSLEAVWSWKTYNNKGYLNASAYSADGNTTTEAYAISPVIDLTEISNPSFSFDHAAKFQTTLKTLCGVCVREEGSTSWTALTVPTWPEAGAWTFVNSGAISLKDFAGKKVQIAFKYGSSSQGADTWEIKNLEVIAN